MRHRTGKYLLVALTVALALRSVAKAAVSCTFSSLETGYGTAVQLDGSPALDAFRGGVLHWTQDPLCASYDPTSLWNGSTAFSSTDFISVGLALTTGDTNGSHPTFQLRDLASQVTPVAASYIAELWYNHMHDLANLDKGSKTRVFQDPRHTFIGAFQLAVWELVYDQGPELSLASGRFTAATGRDSQLAQTWLDELRSEGPNGQKANLQLLSAPLQSMQIVEVPLVQALVQAEPTPEPATIVIWGLFCAIGLAVGRCRGWQRGGSSSTDLRAHTT